MNARTLKPIWLLTGALALSACTTGDSFKRVDKNSDGGASFSEFDAYMKKAVFEEVDSNGDGKVSQQEWRQMNPKDPVSEFNKADSNGDGLITRTEADAAFDREGSMKKLFNKIDTDNNGSLSEAEINVFHTHMKKQPGKTDLEKLQNTSTSS